MKRINAERAGLEGVLPCPVCAALMLCNGLTKHYNKHIEHLEAPGAKPLICSYCAETFWTQDELNAHRKERGHRPKKKKYPPRPKTDRVDPVAHAVANKERYEYVLRADRAHRGDYEGFLRAIGVRRTQRDRTAA